MSTRLGEIKNWINAVLATPQIDNLQYIQSDASSRKYLRLTCADKSFIIMDTQPGEEMGRFIKIAEILEKHGLAVPHIISADLDQGLILMTDLGGSMYLQQLNNADARTTDKLYLDAMTALIKMQTIASAANDYKFPVMNSDYISNRLEVFANWYLQRHLNLKIDTETTAVLNKMQKLFEASFQEHPPLFVHVDYHSRNLMVLNDNNPGILDFQDAMLGPCTYDLVSLFQDAYISYPRAQVEKWVETYTQLAIEAGLLQPQVSSHEILRNFDIVGLQRHIKNLGVFARLHHRDKKSNYLKDIPMLINYITDTCSRYPELSWLFDFLRDKTVEFVSID